MIFNLGHLRSSGQECGFLDTDHFLLVNSCGYQRFITKNFTTLREKGRLDYQIIYIHKGRGVFLFPSQTQELAKGHIIIYRPGEKQHYAYDFADYTETCWIHFTGRGVEECLSRAGFGGKNVYYIGLSETCLELFKRIIAELQLKRPLYESITGALFLELLFHMGRKHAQAIKGVNRAHEAGMEKIVEYIHSCYNKKYSVKDLAQQCSLSIYRFIHNFKSYTGMAPIEYLTRVRIDKAKELLENSLLNIGEISNIVGYDNPLYFSRVFRKKTGGSPSSFRKSMHMNERCITD